MYIYIFLNKNTLIYHKYFGCFQNLLYIYISFFKVKGKSGLLVVLSVVERSPSQSITL